MHILPDRRGNCNCTTCFHERLDAGDKAMKWFFGGVAFFAVAIIATVIAIITDANAAFGVAFFTYIGAGISYVQFSYWDKISQTPTF